MRCVRYKPLLLSDPRLQPVEHIIKSLGELRQFVLDGRSFDPAVHILDRDVVCGLCHVAYGFEDPFAHRIPRCRRCDQSYRSERQQDIPQSIEQSHVGNDRSKEIEGHGSAGVSACHLRTIDERRIDLCNVHVLITPKGRVGNQICIESLERNIAWVGIEEH